MNRLMIGGIEYRVVEQEDLKDVEDESVSLYGQLLYGKSRINLEVTLPSVQKWVTLWHEAMHAVLVHAGYDEHPEAILSALAHGVVQLLQDNESMRSI